MTSRITSKPLTVINQIIYEGIYDFDGLVIVDRIDFAGPLHQTLSFTNCEFTDGFSFSEVSLQEDITFEQCEFGARLSFANMKFNNPSKGNIYLRNCKIEVLRMTTLLGGSLDIDSCDIDNVELSHSNIDSFIWFEGSGSQVNMVQVKGRNFMLRSLNLIAELKVSNCKFESMELFKIKGECSVYLRELEAKKFYVRDSSWGQWESVDVSGDQKCCATEV